MDARSGNEQAAVKAGTKGAVTNETTMERTSERELTVTRTFDAPARLVFEAWSKPELFRAWWVPKSAGIAMVSCEMDVRTGGTYRMVFRHPASGEPMAFHGRYIEVVPNARIVWTNEESADGAVTMVTFEERGERTVVMMRDLYPSKDALDAAIASESTGAAREQFAQLDEFLAAMGAKTG